MSDSFVLWFYFKAIILQPSVHPATLPIYQVMLVALRTYPVVQEELLIYQEVPVVLLLCLAEQAALQIYWVGLVVPLFCRVVPEQIALTL